MVGETELALRHSSAQELSPFCLMRRTKPMRGTISDWKGVGFLGIDGIRSGSGEKIG